jgi:hypothetical protein
VRRAVLAARRPGSRLWAAVALAVAVAAMLSPVAQAAEQKLTAGDGAAFDLFGKSVAISGDTAIVGAHGDDFGASADQGSAYVFVRSGGVWTQEQKLTASDGRVSDEFGWSVAISGDTAIVGAPGDDFGPQGSQGSAYVFVRSGGVWTEEQKLAASDGGVSDEFGWSVAIGGDTVVVGARGDHVGANGFQGSAYVFVRSGGVWTQEQKLTASDGAFVDRFGSSVAIGTDTAVVGARLDDVGANGDQGSAYVFARSGGVWTQEQKLTASDGAASEQFGSSVAIGGDTIVAGAPFDAQGSGYVFVRSGGVWMEQQKLTASDGGAFDQFGWSVAIGGDTIVAGAPTDAVGANGLQGSGYVFARSGGVWTEEQKLTASDGGTGDRFGSSVAINGDTIVAGAPDDDVGANLDQGSVYVFELAAVPANVALSPIAGVNEVGTSHTVTATVTDADGQPVADVVVRFTVTGSVSASGSCTTGSNGQCGFTYSGPSLPGADAISAYADSDGDGVQDAGEPAGAATNSWLLPSSSPGEASGGGNIADAAGNKIAFGFSAKNENNGLQGRCNLVDPNANVMIKCEDVTALVMSGNEATIYGNATHDGVATTYVIRVKDVADPGKGQDTFSIQTASGYSRSGTLTAGNIQVG